MSRIGSLPLKPPAGVDVNVDGRNVRVKGPKGEVTFVMPAGVRVDAADGELTVNRLSNSKADKAAHGTARRLLGNAVHGVSTPYAITLEIVGVGYTSNIRGRSIALKVGYANEVVLAFPDGVDVTTPSAIQMIVTGCDKQMCGEFAARIRRVRPPEPYNGKGIRYQNERIQRKAGKSFASAG